MCLVDSEESSRQPRLSTFCHDGSLGIKISKEKVREFFIATDGRRIPNEQLLKAVFDMVRWSDGQMVRWSPDKEQKLFTNILLCPVARAFLHEKKQEVPFLLIFLRN